MKAIVLTRYGTSSEVLSLRDVAEPELRPNQVRVKVMATTVNDWDWSFMRGRPFIYRLFMGLFKPRVSILGAEVAGRVEAVGADVSSFKPGDAVYGDISEAGFGGFAEYVCVDENALVAMPDGMSFTDAAAIPHAAGLAQQALFDVGCLGDDQKLLINGAGGGVGIIGVQLAQQKNAKVTGVDSGPKLEMMRAAGFDHVIDYETQDFTNTAEKYDRILDCKTTRPIWHYARALRPGGIYATVGGALPRLLQVLLLGPLLGLLTGKKFRLVSLKPNKDMERVNALYATGRLKLAIDGPVALADVPAAVDYFGAAKHKGKVVVEVGRD